MSPTSEPTLVQEVEPPRDQGMKNIIEPCADNKMSENEMSDIVVLENVKENDIGDKTEVRAETSNNEVKHGHTWKLDEYDPSLDIPIALRKCTKS